MEGTAKGQIRFEPDGCVTSTVFNSSTFRHFKGENNMNKEILNKLKELRKKAHKKNFTVVDSQKDKRFLNEYVYKNLEKLYNKEY